MRWDLHVHSRHSFDSVARPAAILRRARRCGLDGVAITDHDTIEGALAARAIRGPGDPAIVVGEEVSTDAGDLIGLFLEHRVEPGVVSRVADDIRSQGGLVVLPHPYRGHAVSDVLLGLVDVLETSNARTPPGKDADAAALARRAGKPGIAVSDAHFSFHVGAAWIETSDDDLKGALRTGAFTRRPGRTPPSMTALSQLIKSVRQGRVHMIPAQLGCIGVGIVRAREREPKEP